MSADISSDLKAILDGADFKIERDDALILNSETHEQRVIPGLRVFLKSESGRFKKGAWLVANKQNGEETILQAFIDFVNAMKGQS